MPVGSDQMMTTYLAVFRCTPILRLFDDKDLPLELELGVENGDTSALFLSVCCKLFSFPPKPEPDVDGDGEKIDSVSILARFSSGSEVGTRRSSEAIRTSSSVSGRSLISEKNGLKFYFFLSGKLIEVEGSVWLTS
jgi:hypothetical protein